MVNPVPIEYRGVVQYYLLTQNVAWFSKVELGNEYSLLKTLAKRSIRQV